MVGVQQQASDSCAVFFLSSNYKDLRCLFFGVILALYLFDGFKAAKFLEKSKGESMSRLHRYQTTLKSPVKIVGKGLHSGRIVSLSILPAPANYGIRFLRTDAAQSAPVRASFESISSTQLNTTIGYGETSVSTIEHLMAAFVGLGIYNALVKLNGPEVPILDGSASEFVRRMEAVGVQRLDKPQRLLRIKREFEFKQGDQFFRLVPSIGQRIKCSIEFDHRIIGFQSLDFRPSFEAFRSISQARTFCNVQDVDAMRERGLALGGSLENAIVLSEEGVMNPDGLRSPSEFVQHKLLDLMGDLSLLGMPLMGDIIAHKPGHALSAKFMQALSERWDDIFEVISVEEFIEDQRQPSVADEAPVLAYFA